MLWTVLGTRGEVTAHVLYLLSLRHFVLAATHMCQNVQLQTTRRNRL